MSIFSDVYRNITDSARGLKKLRVQTLCAMLIAINIALEYFGSIYVSPSIKISTSFLALAATGLLLGPVPAALNGALTDFIQWLIKPAGAFFPGYTLSAALGGFIYGLCLYKRDRKGLFIGVPVSKAIVNLFINILLNTLWYTMLTGTPYNVIFVSRAVKNLTLLPIEVVLMYAISLFLLRNKDKLMRGI